ncbi:MAG TPA: DUF2515 family protein [Bacillaceae bacterium]
MASNLDWRPRFKALPDDADDTAVTETILREIFRGNKDNISRTQWYFEFYLRHPEIRWAFLASMVSRNAGWNMCDLYGPTMRGLLDESERNQLLLTYERANWMIFRDAFPQLLLYHYSTEMRRPLLHLFEPFLISSYMKKEWSHYYQHKDGKRLMYAMIANEQNVIQKPVIQHPVYQKRIFISPLFYIQEWFHFSCVLFPTLHGQLYGFSVEGFRKLEERIQLGKRLSSILFHRDLYPYFLRFSQNVEHTGSRYDFERYLHTKKRRDTPYLRAAIPVLEHHVHEFDDWSTSIKPKREWLSSQQEDIPASMTKWYLNKRKQLQTLQLMKDLLIRKE